MKSTTVILIALLIGLTSVILPVNNIAAEDTPYLILWNVQAKTGQVLALDDPDGDHLFTRITPVVGGQYTYRVAIGAAKQPIYGADGKKGGAPMPLEVDGNRMVTFTYDAATHLMTPSIGDLFIPPRRVVLAGNLQDEFGHTSGPFGGPWDPAAETTRMSPVGSGLYVFTGTLPAGTYEYKVAIGGDWKENYGQGGKQDGANIVLTVPEPRAVTFYYNDHTHKIADSTWYAILPKEQLPRILGDLQAFSDQELTLADDDFDMVYSLSLSLPQGTYAAQIIFRDAAPVPFEIRLPQDRTATIYFDPATHEVIVDDGSLAADQMRHDTYSRLYRTPFEAVKTGAPVTLRLQARKGDLQSVVLIVGKADLLNGERRYGVADREQALAYIETRQLAEGGEADVWGVTLTFDEPGLYGYKFRVNDLKEYGDDAKAGGIGKAVMRGAEYFPLTVYAADFTIPEWLQEGIIYQIFPDRFFNGNQSNDTLKTTARGAEPLVLHAWTDTPSAPTLKNDADAFWNNDFFGGDLAGIRHKLDYLQSLGVTILYLNPIFSAASNHKYDAADYDQLDPLFGTDEEFTALADELRQRGMHLILDGVFNHVGDDSIYFDRYGKYPWVGAYEYWSRVYDKLNTPMLRREDAKAETERELLAEGQRFSPYNWHNWFTIRNAQTQGRYEYDGWAGYDSLPVFIEPEGSELNNRAWADYMLYDANSVAKRWLKRGSSGWRLDVATEVDTTFWQAFRTELKQMRLPSGEVPVILGETWQDAAHFLLGDQFDSVMNYGFRYAVIETFLLNGDAAGAEIVLQSMRQNYPKEACDALMNLIGSHDTARALYILGGGQDQQVIAEAGKNFDFDLGKQRLKLAALFQMGYPGAPAIYYGDEAGLTGARDPDCRRPYPWGQEDHELLAFYRQVTAIRTAHTALFAHGDLWPLYAAGDVYVYGRQAGEQYAVVALNRGNAVQDITIPLQGQIPDGVGLQDQLDASFSATVTKDQLRLKLPPLSGRLLMSF